MLYHLFTYFTDKVGLFRVFRYPSFRIPAAALTALVLTLWLFPRFIDLLRERQHGQTKVREDTPDTHKKKHGTPTMGGLFILCPRRWHAAVCGPDLTNVLGVGGAAGPAGFRGHGLRGRLPQDHQAELQGPRRAPEAVSGRRCSAWGHVSMLRWRRPSGYFPTPSPRHPPVPAVRAGALVQPRHGLALRTVCLAGDCGHLQRGEPHGWPGWPGHRPHHRQQQHLHCALLRGWALPSHHQRATSAGCRLF